MLSNHTYSDLPLETLESFRSRIGYQYEPLSCLNVPKDQDQKILPDGKLAPYWGDTVIFEFDQDNQPLLDSLTRIRDDLHARHKHLLCEPLPEDSWHITLHDLMHASAENRNDVLKDFEQRSIAVDNLLKQLREIYSDPIPMRPTMIFNMVSRSIVIGFEPADENACRALMHMHRALQEIVRLDYPLTPHITIAYYKPPMLDEEGNPIPLPQDEVDALRRSLQEIPGRHDLADFCLHTRNLHHRCFRDMARYISKEDFLKAFFDDQMKSSISRIEKGTSYYTVIHDLAGDSLNLSIPQSEKRYRQAFLHYQTSTEKRYFGELKPLKTSCSPQFASQIPRDIMLAVIVMNMRERGIFGTTMKPDDLIYHCLCELKW